MTLTSYKIRFHDRHVRAVPAGAPGPGVDLLGADAAAVMTAAQPMLAWLDAREPGVVVRSISVRLGAPAPRVLVSVAAEPKPRALRFESPYADELCEAGREAERTIAGACVMALAKRRA